MTSGSGVRVVRRWAVALVVGLVVAQGAPAQTADPDPRLQRADQLNSQVVQFYGQGRYAEALALANEVLSLREAALDAGHADVGVALSNLAALYQQVGRYEQALPLIQRALAIAEKVQGPEHPNTGTRLNNLALLYKDMGRYEQALPLLERALAISEKVEGPDHLSTGGSLNNLAMLYQDMGRYEQALPLYLRRPTRIDSCWTGFSVRNGASPG